ncbi:hypothetical protein GL325_12535 [Aeromicrobium sp. 636]|uniref:Uncharacterized protein n=1 Tax=Aeromicrobium senzhongii TaxID=2663859 RepID=A0A8I0K0L5_9ACTN|nr:MULTISPECIES: hypothetical protein [Aeromicrobium]MBC9227152.1 hypothetical protein [Aeromicrobium senzhongii]MCQ3999251.1 hypothetical protein [Aeromicrobium sp. 636]
MTVSLAQTALDFEREVDRIQEWFLTGSIAKVVEHSPFPYAPLADGCVVSLWDAWGRFVRNLILTCAAGDVESAGGAVYAPKVQRTPTDALAHLEAEKHAGKSYQLSFGKRGEPKWYIAKDTFEIAETLELENGPEIGGALTASQIQLSESIIVDNPSASLQKLRNYVAHKTEVNFKKVADVLPVNDHEDLDSYLRSRTHGGSQVFCDWADAMVALGHAAVE